MQDFTSLKERKGSRQLNSLLPARMTMITDHHEPGALSENAVNIEAAVPISLAPSITHKIPEIRRRRAWASLGSSGESRELLLPQQSLRSMTAVTAQAEELESLRLRELSIRTPLELYEMLSMWDICLMNLLELFVAASKNGRFHAVRFRKSTVCDCWSPVVAQTNRTSLLSI